MSESMLPGTKLGVWLLAGIALLAGGVGVTIAYRHGLVKLPSRQVGNDQLLPAIEISGKRLLEEYDENAARAAAKYEGRVLIVSGKVYAIEQFHLYIDTDTRIGVIGEFEKSADLVPIRKGDEVRIRGICTGKRKLEKCALLK